MTLNGCSSSGDSGGDGGVDLAATDLVAGKYACHDTYQEMFTMPAGYPNGTGSFVWTSTVVENGDGTITVNNTNGTTDTGATIVGSCVVKETLSGTTATLVGTPSCSFSNGFTAVYTKLDWTFTSAGASGPVGFDISGTSGGGDGGGASIPIAATCAGTFTCTRM